jgi:hypothetical protein
MMEAVSNLVAAHLESERTFVLNESILRFFSDASNDESLDNLSPRTADFSERLMPYIVKTNDEFLNRGSIDAWYPSPNGIDFLITHPPRWPDYLNRGESDRGLRGTWPRDYWR